VDELLQLFESALTQKFEESSRFAARNDEALDLIQLFGLFHQHNFSAQLLEPLAVGVEISLQGQNTNFLRRAPIVVDDMGEVVDSCFAGSLPSTLQLGFMVQFEILPASSRTAA
jgi:hypothetical protein